MAHKLDFRGIVHTLLSLVPYLERADVCSWTSEVSIRTLVCIGSLSGVSRRLFVSPQEQCHTTCFMETELGWPSSAVSASTHQVISPRQFVIFEMDAGDSISGTYSCMGSISLTEQSPWPPSIFFQTGPEIHNIVPAGCKPVAPLVATSHVLGLQMWASMLGSLLTISVTLGMKPKASHKLNNTHHTDIPSPVKAIIKFSLYKYGKGDVRQTDVSSPLWQIKFYLSTAQTCSSSSLK